MQPLAYRVIVSDVFIRNLGSNVLMCVRLIMALTGVLIQLVAAAILRPYTAYFGVGYFCGEIRKLKSFSLQLFAADHEFNAVGDFDNFFCISHLYQKIC